METNQTLYNNQAGHRSPVVVTLLTSTGNRELDTGRMPGTDTGDLAKTLVSLPRQLLRVPTGSHSLDSVTLRHSDDVDHLVLGKDVLDGNSLLHVLTGPFKLLLDGSSVQLDFHDVGLLLAPLQHRHLGVGDDTDDLR